MRVVLSENTTKGLLCHGTEVLLRVLGEVIRARKPTRLPVVMTRGKVKGVRAFAAR